MSFDASRFPFDPWKDNAGVVALQGRVQLDSDWNDWLAILSRRIQAGTMDVVGRAVVPATTPFGFAIKASQDASGQRHLTIGAGRMYVDGLLVENHGPPAAAQWDPALAELSGAPQEPPPDAPEVDLDFTQQPYLPGAALPSGNGPFLAYLDAWQRAVTHLEDPDLVEKAVAVDTTGRIRTVWQVRLLDLSNLQPPVNCSTSLPAWDALIQPPASRLTTGVAQSGTPGPCCLTPNTGYTGLENQLYRVEIHQSGAANASGTATNPAATFKWSRDNASVATAVSAITQTTAKLTNTPTSLLTVDSTGRDDVLGFVPGDWIEITDDVREFNRQAGDLRQIDVDGVDKANRTIRLATPVSSDLQNNLTNPPANYPHCHTRIQRWDQQGKVIQKDGTLWVDLDAAGRGDIPVPPAGTELVLENGVTVSFDLSPANGAFGVGDYWTFVARASDGSVEPLTKAPPNGIYHHYTRLAVVTFPSTVSDCRLPWPPEPASCACTVCVEVADFQRDPGAILAALEKVSALGGGRVCLGAGTFALGGSALQITGLQNVTLSGQGPATVLAYAGTGPAVIIDTCLGQRLDNLSIVALLLPPAPPGNRPAAAATGRQIPIGLLVRNSVGVEVKRCGIGAPATTAQAEAAIAGANSAAIVLDGVLGASEFDQNVLIGDLGVVAAASLVAAGIMPGGSQAAPPPLALTGCTIADNLMTCPIAGVVLGEAGQEAGAYFHFSDNAIAGNKVLGGAFAGIFAEGLTAAGAAVRIMRNDLEILGTGIDARLDGLVVADNVVTQADLALTLPGAPAKTGIGIAVRGVAGSKLSPFAAQVHRNRIVGIAGSGILLDAPSATISILDNAVFGTTALGIASGTSAAADLLVRGNEVLIVADAPSTGGGAVGIYALAIDAAIENNTVGAIGNAAGGTGPVAGIYAAALASAKITGNRIHEIGPPPAAPPPPPPPAAAAPQPPISYGILAGAFDDISVSGNIIQQASAPPSAPGNFTGIRIDESFHPPGPVAVLVEGNTVEGLSGQPLVQIANQFPGVADCVVIGNQCRQQGASVQPGPTLSISGATAIVGNNRIGGPARVAISVNVSRSAVTPSQIPAATIVGNIVSGEIQGMNSVWAPLNIVVTPP
jgi:Family of unknown function (DUF6519)